MSVVVVSSLFLLSVTGPSYPINGKVSPPTIQLKAKCVVVGQNVTFGDISNITDSNTLSPALKSELRNVVIRKAPPPGESTDISRNEIKRRLERAGFGTVVQSIQGPRNIRVVSAHEEIDKAFIKEELA